jgi:hypothetical protein
MLAAPKIITELPKFEYYRDVFISGSKDERKKFIAGVLSEIERGGVVRRKRIRLWK